mmetsp:Transcript_41547/g.36906  ORF Transcript_41547/g.36906 Transcript_41547/m.36906 type:complete len:99 (-) Transcript_41547:2658-2954(-)
MLLCLKFYLVSPNINTLIEFSKYYNSQTSKYKTIKDTVDLQHGILFPEFIYILLKAIQFNQNKESDYEEEKEQEDLVFDPQLAEMIKIHANDEDLTDF